MALGRGFFRAWIFFSAIWIGLMVYLHEPKSYSFRRSVYETKYNNGRVVQFDLGKKRADLLHEVDAWMRAERPDISDLQVLKFSEQLVTNFEAEHQAGMDKTKTVWLKTVLPPLVLLILGLCIFWIVRGFRSRTKPLVPN